MLLIPENRGIRDQLRNAAPGAISAAARKGSKDDEASRKGSRAGANVIKPSSCRAK